MDFLRYEKLIKANVKLLNEAASSMMLLFPDAHQEASLQVLAPYLASGLTVKDLHTFSTEDTIQKNVAEFDLFASSPTVNKSSGGMNRIIDGFLADLDYSLSNGLSMILFGFNGAGKTHSAKYLLYKTIEADRSGYYINSAELQRLHNKVNFSGEDDFSSRCVHDHVVNCDLLLIDEVGKESLTDNFIIAFEAILKHRASRDKSTIMVTNLNFDNGGKNEFMQRYGSSVYNILYEHYRVLLLSSKGEFRKKERKVWK